MFYYFIILRVANGVYNNKEYIDDYSSWTNGENIEGTIKEIISSISDEDANKFEIVDGNLIANGNITDKEKEWLEDSGVSSKIGIDITVSSNGCQIKDTVEIDITDVPKYGTVILTIKYIWDTNSDKKLVTDSIWDSAEVYTNVITKIGLNKTGQYLHVLADCGEENKQTYVSKSFDFGNVEPTTKPSINAGVFATVNSKYIDSKGDIAIIPKGFKVSIKSTEQFIDDGLVILDKDDNEYVWIPVSDGKLDRKEYGKYWEAGRQLSDFSETLPSALVISVETYKGFYIARYEAGAVGDVTSIAEDGSVKPLSKPSINVWNTIPYDSNGTNSDTPTGTGAYKVANSLYPASDFKVGATSTLIYGAQWDEALEFIATKDSTYPTNSTGKGNYEINSTTDSSLKLTGYYGVNNIYDMAGNVWEWTMEDYLIYSVIRSGCYSNPAADFPASSRYHNPGGPGQKNNIFIGFRIALYIK